ncbi:MSMEG_1061 family FMN-dependent PPOX-type flavoprotein [Streptomyces sp. A0592]|uniref:MSMEG_1061 family FMN-dependent PPOX-type flavoprotein n=1 Tax=Streptomyces sp. A0592 TaxID=2563099 RepID=UPI00109E8349|nr:MSMEG_1061 family FMN-dependent PPOX-type flavoprotein [Streptomyces sp. A0592]THA86188.1 pyridoxamine 5'-phosphate oxidase family protein [Streptomyces sp. A0592]
MEYEEITTEEELRELVGPVNSVVFRKATPTLRAYETEWISNSPFCMIATAAPDGTCDVSPRGDPPGFVRILDERTLAVPDRPGNRRLDTWRNVLQNPQVGMIFLIPGRGDTLRVNGRARLIRSAPFFDDMVVRGSRPQLALVVSVEEAYFHCAKSFMRAKLWEPESWAPEAVSSRARIAQATEWTEASLETLERRYGPAYEQHLYPGASQGPPTPGPVDPP